MRVNRLHVGGRSVKLPPVKITEKHQRELVENGYVHIRKFLAGRELAAARKEMLGYFPSSEELEDKPQRYGFIQEDPEHLQIEFPFDGKMLNDVSTHPDLIDSVERLLGTPDVLLSQAAIWAKYAGTGDFDQGLHLDYRGNTLVVPRDDGSFRQVNMILYYTDVDATMGPTMVVPQSKTHDLPPWPTHRPRLKNPVLYENERPILAKAGDLLVFSMNTWHRASDMTAESGVRFSHHMVWRAAEHGFQGYHQWSKHGENEELERFIAGATPRQRQVLGFPAPGHKYWNAQTLAAVQLRYPGMDLGPYQSKRPKASAR